MNLQKSPLGLLGSLDLKTTGQAPSEFAETVVPTFAAQEFYLLQQLESVTVPLTMAIGATTVATSPANLEVPQGEAWRVLAYSVDATVAAADAALSFRATMAVQTVINQFTYTFGTYGMDGSLSGGASFVRVLGTQLYFPLWLRAGNAIIAGARASAAVTVAVPVNVRVLFNRVRE